MQHQPENFPGLNVIVSRLQSTLAEWKTVSGCQCPNTLIDC